MFETKEEVKNKQEMKKTQVFNVIILDRIDSLDLTDLELIKTCYEEMYDHRPLFFLDEIQLVKGWEKFASRLADQKYQVYITGRFAIAHRKNQIRSVFFQSGIKKSRVE